MVSVLARTEEDLAAARRLPSPAKSDGPRVNFRPEAGHNRGVGIGLVARPGRCAPASPEPCSWGTKNDHSHARSGSRTPGSELVAGGRGADHAPHQPASSQPEWRKHELQAEQATSGVGASRTYGLLREPPDLLDHLPSCEDRRSAPAVLLKGAPLDR